MNNILIKDSLEVNARKIYNSIRNLVYCKCLRQDVCFNSQGFHHLLYNGSGHARSVEEKKHKLELVPLAVPVIMSAVNVSYRRNIEGIKRKKNSVCKPIEYWGLTATAGKNKIKVKVILKRVGVGQMIFWSIMRLKQSKNTA